MFLNQVLTSPLSNYYFATVTFKAKQLIAN